jgi:hypothetical protein
MLADREKGYQRLRLTTPPGLEVAMRLYSAYGFMQVAKSEETFHGSEFPEVTFETYFA